eukprot:gb/GEZN01017336.1/.p1 GENE.gb/GEZN01017336.1/~~gb/GEZN01017336.1/.p1  ORF type:complete len:175 (+),score=16.98 gb/GEZN01017336.1/:208-732(+)
MFGVIYEELAVLKYLQSMDVGETRQMKSRFKRFRREYIARLQHDGPYSRLQENWLHMPSFYDEVGNRDILRIAIQWLQPQLKSHGDTTKFSVDVNEETSFLRDVIVPGVQRLWENFRENNVRCMACDSHLNTERRKKCTCCGNTYYCDRKCQLLDWQKHKVRRGNQAYRAATLL